MNEISWWHSAYEIVSTINESQTKKIFNFTTSPVVLLQQTHNTPCYKLGDCGLICAKMNAKSVSRGHVGRGDVDDK